MKYIVVTGGVMSGIGKGTIMSSIGALLKAHGHSVTAVKIDPYLNQDAGTMSPFEHGECYVLQDGGETDLDLGNYERFLNIRLTKDHNITTGKIYQSVLNKERNGEYLGKTVQVIPHITNEIQEQIERASKIKVSDEEPTICLVELGGTIGDIESLHFVEALRRLSTNNDTFFCHVGYIPTLKTSGETKTKPTQASIRELHRLGIRPNLLFCRCEEALDQNTLDKLESFCQVSAVSVHNVNNIYQVPLMFEEENICEIIGNHLNLETSNTSEQTTANLDEWRRFADSYENGFEVNVGIVGKYTGLHDSYLSLTNAIKHAAIHQNKKPIIHFVEASSITTQTLNTLDKFDYVVIPGGFDTRGTEGMILTASYCRTYKIPMLGICLGMQIIVIEYALHMGLEGANSTELDPNTPHPIIIKMDELENTMGGTMRLGLRGSTVRPNTLAYDLYKTNEIQERHRHRYEVNPEYLKKIKEWDLDISCTSDLRVEIVELKDQFYIGCQFHPEFNSYPDEPHPLFLGLLDAFN